jgi:hypothetical protein
MALDLAATYWCDGCNRSLPGAEAETMRAGSGTLAICPTCKRALVVESRPAGVATGRPAPLATADGSARGGSYPEVLGRAFLFPFRPMTLAIFAATTVVAYVAGWVPLLGGLIGTAVQVAFLFQIVRTTAVGQDDFTMEAETVLDWVSPLGRYFGAFLVAAMPALAAWLATRNVALAAAGGVAGMVYLPAAFIAASYPSGCLGPLNPLPAIGLIAKIPGAYAVTLAFVAVAVGLGVGLGYVAAALARALAVVPALPSLISMLLHLLPAAIAARMLGLLVREHGDELFGG